MKKLLMIGILMLGALPAEANASGPVEHAILSNTSSCNAARDKAIARIEQERNIRVVQHQSRPHEYDDAPIKERWEAYHLSFEGNNTANVMHSKAILTEAAKLIFEGCPTAGLVNFGQYQTDGGILLGLNADQSIHEFDCIAAHLYRQPTINWGQTICL